MGVFLLYTVYNVTDCILLTESCTNGHGAQQWKSSGQGVQSCVTMKRPNHKSNSCFLALVALKKVFLGSLVGCIVMVNTIKKTQIPFSATIALTQTKQVHSTKCSTANAISHSYQRV